MNWNRRQLLQAGAALAAGPAAAQSGGSGRPVSLLVPYTVGGSSDVAARHMAPEWAKTLEQAMIVENLAGAGGALAVQKMLRSPPDGQTVLWGGMSEALLVPMINPSVGYKPADLLPVGYGGASPVVFVVRPDFPAQNMDEFIALVRKSPGKYSFGSAGIGSFAHVMGELVKLRAGLFMVHVPYRGGAQIMTDVIGGQLDVGITVPATVAPMLASKRVRALSISSRTRVPQYPDLPTFSESQALKGLDMGIWVCGFVHPQTPEPIVQRLHASFNGAVNSAAMREARSKLAFELPAVLTLPQCKSFLAEEFRRYQPVTARIKPE